MFGALAEPMRRQLLQTIAQHPATATELASELPISRQAVTKHLSSLSEAGLLERERAGRDIRYRAHPGSADRGDVVDGRRSAASGTTG